METGDLRQPNIYIGKLSADIGKTISSIRLFVLFWLCCLDAVMLVSTPMY